MIGLAAIAVPLIARLSRRTGATAGEAAAARPGDAIIRRPMLQWDRAATINAPPDRVWPWLVQMGYHRGGWYTNTTLDNAIWGIDSYNEDVIRPEFLNLAVGDIVPDGPGYAAYFHVMELSKPSALVYHSVRHPRRGHPIDPSEPGAVETLENRLRDAGEYLDFSWAFILDPTSNGNTRLFIRTRALFAPPWIRLLQPLLGLVDMYYSHSMLRGIAARAEMPTESTVDRPHRGVRADIRGGSSA